LHAALTGEDFWYYADFSGRLDLLARALAEGLGWQGEYMPHEATARGEPSAYLPPTAFVGYLQNHDQTGNRPRGERLTTLAGEEALRAAIAITLLAPHVPMLFMGEEWGSRRPFLFFSDLGEDLAASIRSHRAEELARFPGESHDAAPPPDPMSPEAFEASKLDWQAMADAPGSAMLTLYRDLLATRRAEIVPRLAGMGGNAGRYNMLGANAMCIDWTLGDGSRLTLVANLSDQPLADPAIGLSGHTIWCEGIAEDGRLGPWSVLWQRSIAG
jgi:maltooligosyltrehalose trehalohydrolase